MMDLLTIQPGCFTVIININLYHKLQVIANDEITSNRVCDGRKWFTNSYWSFIVTNYFKVKVPGKLPFSLILRNVNFLQESKISLDYSIICSCIFYLNREIYILLIQGSRSAAKCTTLTFQPFVVSPPSPAPLSWPTLQSVPAPVRPGCPRSHASGAPRISSLHIRPGCICPWLCSLEYETSPSPSSSSANWLYQGPRPQSCRYVPTREPSSESLSAWSFRRDFDVFLLLLER